MKTKRAYLIKERAFEIREDDISPKDNQILVKVKLCGLCNWELHFYKGIGGEYYTNYPMVIGHEWAGIVAEKGKNVTDFEIGDKVTFLPGDFQGFAEYTAVDAKDCYKINPDVDLDNAMGEPLKCILTVLSNAQPKAGDFGLVLGCGPMGLWCIQALKGNMLGGLIAVDIDDGKLELAKKFGATHVINSQKENIIERIKEITDGSMCDFVIEGTGIPKLFENAIQYLKNSGSLILMSSHEKPCEAFDFRPAIDRGIHFHIAHPNSSHNQADDMRRAVALINNGTFNNKKIITHRFKIEEIGKAFETLENKPKDYIKGVIEFDWEV